jgi:hypothetical protein
MRHFKCFLSCVLIITIFLSSAFPLAPAKANWFDSFSNSIVSHSANSWSLQQQNHYAAGGFSIRFNNHNNRLFSITAPRVSAGCGGIDAFWGAFSFLDPEYLVQMLRNILQAAPAFAFKLALQALCESCASVLAELMAIAEALNSLALDECGMSQAIVSTGAAALSSILGMETKTGAKDGGGTGWLSTLQEFRGNVQGFVLKLNEMMSFKFCGSLSGNARTRCEKIYASSGTLWARMRDWDEAKNVADNQMGEDFIALFRALLGDIKLDPGSQEEKDEDDNPISTQSDDPSRAMIKHYGACQGYVSPSTVIKVMTSTSLNGENNMNTELPMWPLDSGNCKVQTLPSSLRIGQRASHAIGEILNKVISSPTTALNDDTLNIINLNTVPIYKIINLFSLRQRIAGSEFMSVDEKNLVVKLSAIGHATYIIENGLRKAQQLMNTMYSELAPVVGEIEGQDVRYTSAKMDFDNYVAQTISELHQTQNVELQEYYDKMKVIENVLNVQRNLEQRIFTPLFSLR